MAVDQPTYPVIIELQDTAAALVFSPFPKTLTSGSSFLLRATVKNGGAAADLAGCTAKLYGRPLGAPMGVPAVELATGSISGNIIDFDVDRDLIPDSWSTYSTSVPQICIWFEVLETATLTRWSREALVFVRDASRIGDGQTQPLAQILDTVVGDLTLTQGMSGCEVPWDGAGSFVIPALRKGVTIVVRNRNEADKAWTASGTTIVEPDDYIKIRRKGTISITYLTDTEVWIVGNTSP